MQTCLSDLLAALTKGGTVPVCLAYHPDADSGDGDGWALEIGDRHHYGTIDGLIVKARELAMRVSVEQTDQERA